MKKIILMGAVGCGKTTLTQALHGQSLDYDKTQALQFHEDIIDTPGEYILHRKFIQSLTVTAAESDVIGLVQSVAEQEQIFSYGFAGMFPKETLGIITKIDLAQSTEEIRFVESQLKEAGAKKIFKISAYQQKGIGELKKYLEGS
ncbi:MAG: EutP/PduV family microcompartment system protein [Streptococcaceae bacterium]|jgi:ethanolamine utilization protein EutP|nr:EutP/PduV family microcompartment system protein [Streptococcaceae bacterium]